jgi:hypothetical protein
VNTKTYRRELARRKARYAARGYASDRRPAAVREDRGAIKRLMRVLKDR